MRKYIFAGILAASPVFGFTLASPPIHAGDTQFVRCAAVVSRPGANVTVDIVTGDGRDGTDVRASGYRYDTGEQCEWSAGSLPSTDARFCVVVVSGAAARDVRASVEVREGSKLVAVVGF